MTIAIGLVALFIFTIYALVTAEDDDDPHPDCFVPHRHANGHLPEYANCHAQVFRAARFAALGGELDESFFTRLAYESYHFGTDAPGNYRFFDATECVGVYGNGMLMYSVND